VFVVFNLTDKVQARNFRNENKTSLVSRSAGNALFQAIQRYPGWESVPDNEPPRSGFHKELINFSLYPVSASRTGSEV
jgi:hypothetical protein